MSISIVVRRGTGVGATRAGIGVDISTPQDALNTPSMRAMAVTAGTAGTCDMADVSSPVDAGNMAVAADMSMADAASITVTRTGSNPETEAVVRIVAAEKKADAANMDMAANIWFAGNANESQA